MSAAAYSFEVPRPVAQKVSRLRLLVRLYSLSEGVAAVSIVVGLGFWLGLAIDWMFEPQREENAIAGWDTRMASWGSKLFDTTAEEGWAGEFTDANGSGLQGLERVLDLILKGVFVV